MSRHLCLQCVLQSTANSTWYRAPTYIKSRVIAPRRILHRMLESTHVARFLTPTKNVDKYQTTSTSRSSKGPVVPRLLSAAKTITDVCVGRSSSGMYGDDMVYIPQAKSHLPTIMPHVQQHMFVRRRSSPEMYRRDMLIPPNTVPRELSVSDRLVQAAKKTTRMSTWHSFPNFHNRDMLHMPKAQMLPLRRTSTV
jgi:hypothetical protein